MRAVNRRRFLVTGGAAAVGLAMTAPAFGLDRALRTTRQRAVSPEGTTLESVATPSGSGSYRRLRAGPGWPVITRTDLADGAANRDDRRSPIASFVQFTDIHFKDAQSPARFEYMHPLISAAFHPQETLTTQGGTALVRRVNSLRTGPFTGLAPQLVVCTGDNTDNHEHVELDWYLTAFSGGTITPDTGKLGTYEGVQNSNAELYWNPDHPGSDRYKDQGFPHLPGFLEASLEAFASPGLRIPWYAVFGNHDDSVSGTLPPDFPPLDALYTSGLKLEGLSSTEDAEKLADTMTSNPRAAAKLVPHLQGPVRRVTPDERRRPFTPKEFMAAHLQADVDGPGPHGHGFDEQNVAEETGYYTFPVADGVVGISMDTTCRAGFVDGSVGTEQLRWIERRLTEGSSRYYDTDGNAVRHRVADTLFVLFSHHTSKTMDNLFPDPRRPLERRHSGDELVALLHRFPNVLAWVNGHTHRNEIIPQSGKHPEQAFWEINTASHIDYPQHGRVIELADNGDGTVSLFTTLIEADSPYAADHSDTSRRGLAALYRELSYNDIHREDGRVGEASDHNTELLLTNPLGRRVS